MPNQALLSYLKEQTQGGVPLEDVLNACRAAGWPETEIEVATAAFHASESANSKPKLSGYLLRYILGGAIIVIALFTLIFITFNATKSSQSPTDPMYSVADTPQETSNVSFTKDTVTFTTLATSDSVAAPGVPIIDDLWVAGGKLAYLTSTTEVNYQRGTFPVPSKHTLYFGSTSTPHSLTPEQTSTSSRIVPVTNVSNKLTFYTSGSDNLYVGERRFPFTGTLFDIEVTDTDVLYSDEQGIKFNGDIIEDDVYALQRTSPGMALLNGSPAYLKVQIEEGNGAGETQLILNGSSTAQGLLSELTVHNGTLAYVKTDFVQEPTPGIQSVVVSNDQIVSDRYLDIINLKSTNDGLAFLGKKTRYTDSLGYKEAGGYVLVWGGKEYGSNYDMVWGFIESQGRPIYLAARYPQSASGEAEAIDAHDIVADDTVLLSLTPGVESVDEEDIIDVAGYPAARVYNAETMTSYLWYAGQKYFTDHDVKKIVNLNGKLAVLADKDGLRKIYTEE